MRWNRQTGSLFIVAGLLAGGALVALTAGPTVTAAVLQEASPSPASSRTAGETPQRVGTEFFVMIDPAHGGDDKGARLSPKLLEKDLTLALARELKRGLQERGIPARLLRDSDVNLSVERRAEITNEDHAGLYVALHAGPPGSGVRVYSAALPFAATPAAGRFLPWESAQAVSLERSRTLARALAPELRKKGFHAAAATTPLRPLNNLLAPAIAVEWASATGWQSAESQKQQSALASAIAESIAQNRGHLGGRP
jgi:N-acetylmuramoyl-L-alanine amidase